MVVQLPKQDLALTYCKHVEQRHHQSYEDFINARNEIALDIGYARECTYHVVSFYKFFFNLPWRIVCDMLITFCEF